MSLILSILLATGPAPVSAPTPRLDRCPKSAATSEDPIHNRLGDLPPAEAFNAVWRTSECRATVVHARDRLGPVPGKRP